MDAAIGTSYAEELMKRVAISYPPINAGPLLEIASKRDVLTSVWNRYGVEEQKYVLFLSRLSEAKGVDDLIDGYLHSKVSLSDRTRYRLSDLFGFFPVFVPCP